MHHVDPDSRLIAYHRFAEGPAQEACVVVANFTGQPVEKLAAIGFPAAGEWKLRFNSDAKVYDPEFTDFPSGDVTAVEEGQYTDCRAVARWGFGLQRADLFAGRGVGARGPATEVCLHGDIIPPDLMPLLHRSCRQPTD